MRNSRFLSTILLLCMSMAACGGEGATAKSLEGEPHFVLEGESYYPLLNVALVFEMTMTSSIEGTMDGPMGYRQHLQVVASNKTGKVVDGPTVRVNEHEFKLADFPVDGSKQTAPEVSGRQDSLLPPLFYLEPEFTINADGMSCALGAPVHMEKPGGSEIVAEDASLYELVTALIVCGDQ